MCACVCECECVFVDTRSVQEAARASTRSTTLASFVLKAYMLESIRLHALRFTMQWLVFFFSCGRALTEAAFAYDASGRLQKLRA